jgi:signal transduction histidine kinase
MSDSQLLNTPAEPGGRPLGHPHRQASHDGTNDYVNFGERFRTQVMFTTMIAVVLTAVLAASGAIAVNSAWLSTTFASVVVAAGSVLVSVAALGRVYFLSRSFRPGPTAAGRVHDTVHRWNGPSSAPEVTATPATQLPPPVAPWVNLGEPGSATLGNAPELRQEVFGKLAYRLQSLVNRLIHRIDQVEQEIEDPELLKSLYAIDHLATRIRRQIENLAVLGGEAPQRRSNIPVDVNAVMRAAVAEIEHYTLVSTVPIHDAKIHGHVVAEIIHLLAELLENATTFTAADAPKVMLRAHRVTAGLAIQVQDRGIGMSYEDIMRLNRLLDGSTRVDVSQLLQDGRIGLAVVEILARRHNVGAELQPNIFGGTDASIVIPHSLLSDREQVPDPAPPGALPPPPAWQSSAAPAGSSTSGGWAPVSTPSSPSPLPRPPAGETQHHYLSYPQAQQPAPNTSAYPHDGDFQQKDAERSQPALPSRRRGELHSQLWADAAADSSTADAGQGAGTGTAPGTLDNRQELVTHRPDGNMAPADQPDRPALPQRRGSHLRKELREQPAFARPIPGHTPTLMSALQEGRARGRAELTPEESPDSAAQQAQDTEGDSASWQT